MRGTIGLLRTDGGVIRSLFLLATCVAGVGIAPAAAVFFSAATDEQPADSERAQTPLGEIAGVEAPPPVTTVPLTEVPAVQTAYEQARAQIEDGRLQDALETLSGALEEPGGDRYEIHYLLALAKARQGQLGAARASAEVAVRLGHGAADVHYLLAQICQRQGDVESAIPHYRSATLAADRELNNAKVTLAWYYLGQTLAEVGSELAAAQAYERFDIAVWQTHPEHRNADEIALLLAGRSVGLVPERLRLLRGLNRAEEMVRVAEWAREIWPDDGFVTRMYAEALLAAGAAERAFRFCRERWEDPEDASDLLPIAVDAAQTTGRLDEWIGALARDVAEGRGLEQAAELTRHLNRVGAPAQAVRLGRALVAQRPDERDWVWEAAVAQQAAGDLRPALETLIAFVRRQPELAELPRPWLAAWTGWLEPGANVAELVKELRARPDADFATDFVLGVSALAAEQPALADELLQSCVAARPDFAAAYVVPAEMLLAKYQWDAAKEQVNEVLEAQPDLAAAHYVLAEAYDGLDENEQAERAYKRAIKLRPGKLAYKLALARHYQRLGNLLGAQRYFQAARADQPANGEVLEGLIDCYLRDGKVEMARAQLERIDQDLVPRDTLRRILTTMRFLSAAFGPEHLAELKAQFDRYPDDVATARYLAGGLYQWGRFDEAHEVIQQVRRTNPEEYHFAILLANVHAVREEFGEAIALLEALAKRYPNRLAVLRPLTLYCVYDFRFEEGRPALRRLIELEEDEDQRSEYRKRLRDSYLIFGEFDQALRLAESWIEKEPKNEALLMHKAIVLIGAGRSREAFAVLEEWLDRKPDDPGRRERFCDSVKFTQQYEQALKRIREWLSADPSSATLTGWLIDVLIWADRSDEALEVARKFEGTYAESIGRRIWLGRCRSAMGEIDKALEEFDALLAERLVKADQRAEVWEQIVQALAGADRFDQVLARCDQWLKEVEGLDPKPKLKALDWKRRVLQAAGRDRENAEVMEALLAYVPGIAFVLEEPDYNAGLFNDLGYVWVDSGMNLERATQLIRRAVAADPWNVAFIDSLGWAYYKAGDFSNARKYLARAVRLRDGQDPVVYDHLADAAYRLGDRDAARQHWNKAVSLIQAETSERARARLADVAAAVREKLAALERSEPPVLAPTVAEQQEE